VTSSSLCSSLSDPCLCVRLFFHLWRSFDLITALSSPFVDDNSVFSQMESVLLQPDRTLVSDFHYAPLVINLIHVSRATRLSIAMTVVRILPPGRSRLISKVGCGAFVLMWLIVMIQKIFICGIPVPAIPTCSSKSTPILAITSTWSRSPVFSILLTIDEQPTPSALLG